MSSTGYFSIHAYYFVCSGEGYIIEVYVDHDYAGMSYCISHPPYVTYSTNTAGNHLVEVVVFDSSYHPIPGCVDSMYVGCVFPSTSTTTTTTTTSTTSTTLPMPVLSCSVRYGGCSGSEICLFKMSSIGSHACTCSAGSYPYSVCCSASSGILGSSCYSGDGVLSMSGSDNAHVEQYGYGSYGVNVCLSHNSGSVDCTYSSGSCAGGYECVASMSSSTNAHVGACNGFSRKICCRIN